MTDEEYYAMREKEDKEKEELYKKLKDTANELENYRLMLYQNKTHKSNCNGEDEFKYIDDTLFSIQSQLRELHEYCMW